MTKKRQISQSEIAERTGRSRQAVNQLLARGVPEQQILKKPPGSRLTKIEAFGRPGQFSDEGSVSFWSKKIGVTYGRLWYRARMEGSLLAAVKFFRPDLAGLKTLDPEAKLPPGKAASGRKKGDGTRRDG